MIHTHIHTHMYAWRLSATDALVLPPGKPLANYSMEYSMPLTPGSFLINHVRIKTVWEPSYGHMYVCLYPSCTSYLLLQCHVRCHIYTEFVRSLYGRWQTCRRDTSAHRVCISRAGRISKSSVACQMRKTHNIIRYVT